MRCLATSVVMKRAMSSTGSSPLTDEEGGSSLLATHPFYYHFCPSLLSSLLFTPFIIHFAHP